MDAGMYCNELAATESLFMKEPIFPVVSPGLGFSCGRPGAWRTFLTTSLLIYAGVIFRSSRNDFLEMNRGSDWFSIRCCASRRIATSRDVSLDWITLIRLS